MNLYSIYTLNANNLNTYSVLQINVDKYSKEEKLSQLMAKRGYNYSDVLDIHPKRLDNYFQKLDAFYTEHMHSEEEIRLVLDGTGYFDVRDVDNRWIRIAVEKGDLLTLPAGSYHRFTLDNKNNWIKLFRLFGNEPVWSAFNRPADDHPSRIQYVQKSLKGF